MEAAREMTPEEIIVDLFEYHAPTPEHNECPQSPDRSAAIRLVREARMTANASIATKSGGLYR